MQPETPNGETPVVTDPKTNANPTVTPSSQTVDATEVERLRKEAEQATMRANQLANQLKAKEDAEAAAKAKELEEQNQYKTLYEQEKAKREGIEAEREENERKRTLKAESDKLFAQYPDQVRVLAEEAGMSLLGTDETSVEAFKAKLDKVNGLIKSPKVTPNNPGNRTPSANQETVDPNEMHAMLNDPVKFEKYLKENTKGIASMLKPTAQ